MGLDGSYTWPGDPAAGKFNVTVTWEKGGTLIFYAEKTTYIKRLRSMQQVTEPAKPIKIHLYAPKE
ncbi:MAG: hypothetical protein JJT94_12655 [Bernardetiaceae bacterium]|nr:hypothetical protein [Bernardetiaceae bacterium]